MFEWLFRRKKKKNSRLTISIEADGRVVYEAACGGGAGPAEEAKRLGFLLWLVSSGKAAPGLSAAVMSGLGPGMGREVLADCVSRLQNDMSVAAAASATASSFSPPAVRPTKAFEVPPR